MEFGGKLDLVERLGRLRDEGALTHQEFASAKASVLTGEDSGAIAPDEDDQEAGGYRLWRSQSASVTKWVGGVAAVVIVAGIVSYVALQPSESPARTTSARAPQQIAQRQDSVQPALVESNSGTAQADDTLNLAGAAVEAAANNVASASAEVTKQQAGVGQEDDAKDLQIFASDTYRVALANGFEQVSLKGRISNPISESVRVPDLQATMRDASGQVIAAWTVLPPVEMLSPGQSADFSTSAKVPSGGNSVTVTFDSDDRD
jgi:hypothetical protein